MARPIGFDEAVVMERVTAEFWRRGYANTGVRDLTNATGLNESSLYNTFGNKHDLFMAALAAYQKGTSERIAHYTERYQPREALEKIWYWLARRASSDDHHGCMLLNAAIEVGKDDPAVKQFVQEKYQALEDALHELIARGQEAGEISTKRTAMQLAQFFVLTFQGLNSATALAPSHAHTRQLVETALTVLD